MRTVYTDLNIKTTIEKTIFLALNIACEEFHRSMPGHIHGNNSYELHYISSGNGTVNINGQFYPVSPNTLYITGPHVEHKQMPSANDPMTEYCIYFKLKTPASYISSHNGDGIAQKFAETPFWFGQDTQGIFPLFQQIFYELENRYSGYMVQVEALLQQCIVKTVRNYETEKESSKHFSHTNLGDSKYLIVEESFLYNYQNITLENLSSRLGLSTRQTERFLKDYYGKTFSQKRTEAKMSMAKVLLEDSTMNISAIANQLNYSSVEHFSYAFRRYYGLTASAYRKASLAATS